MVPPPPDGREPQTALEISELAEKLSIQKRLDGAFRRIEALELFESRITELICRMAGEGTDDGITKAIGNVVVGAVVFAIKLRSGNSNLWRVGWTAVGGVIVAALGNILGRLHWPL